MKGPAAKELGAKGLVALVLAFGVVLAGCASGEANGVAKPVDKATKKDK